MLNRVESTEFLRETQCLLVTYNCMVKYGIYSLSTIGQLIIPR